MKLWKISQDKNDTYDTYDSAIVAAPTEDDARRINPDAAADGSWPRGRTAWCASILDVKVELIGTAVKGTKAGVVLASYNAG